MLFNELKEHIKNCRYLHVSCNFGKSILVTDCFKVDDKEDALKIINSVHLNLTTLVGIENPEYKVYLSKERINKQYDVYLG